MKRHFRLLSLALALLLLLGLAACGSPAGSSSAAPASSQTSSGSGTASPAGEYKYVCVLLAGDYAAASLGVDVDPGALEPRYVVIPDQAENTVKLEEDGTGYLNWGENNQGPIDWWKLNGSQLQFQAGVAVIDGTLQNGLMRLELEEGFTVFFALPGADTSSLAPMSLEDYQAYVLQAAAGGGDTSAAPQGNLLEALAQTLDGKAGIHLQYELTVEKMGSVQRYDVHARGAVCYSVCTAQVSMGETTSATYVKDGKIYQLSLKDKTGTLVTESALAVDNPLIMDQFYGAVTNRAKDANYTVAQREVNGTVYQAQVYPATDYTPEVAFCFEADGSLAYYVEEAPVAEGAMDIGQCVYRVIAIDSQVDDSLLALADFTLAES